jgi:hypothetical protein
MSSVLPTTYFSRKENHMHRKIQAVALILMFLAFHITAINAQAQSVVQEVYLVWMPSLNETANQTFAKVTFTTDLERAPDRAEIIVTAKPSGTIIGVRSATRQEGRRNILIISLEPTIPPGAGDTEVEVRFDRVQFAQNPINTPVEATGEIYSRSNIQTLADLRLEQAREAIANSKTKEERNIFAGFSATAPSDGDAEADADIALNKWVAPNLFASFILKKSTAVEADPKHFNMAFGYRKVFSTQAGKLRKIRNLVAAAETQANRTPDDPERAREKGAEIANEIDALSNGFLLNLMIDAVGRLEGEAMNFNVTNAIFDIPLQLASRTKRIGDSLFFNLRIIPGGVELGRNLRSENEVLQKYYIGRFKSGAELNFCYAPSDRVDAFPQRIELNLQAVNRYLWRDETAFDEETMEAIGISKGNKSWLQGDLNIFLGETTEGRFGFKVSYLRGKLPPTFSDTRAFTFGLVFQSADDKAGK